jgi:hypothetical protein
MKPEILERQIAYAGYITVERLRIRLTDSAEVSREVERHGDAAAVLRESPLSSGCSRSSRPMSIKDGSPTESY